MTRIMYDSVTSADIPAGALVVAGYVDGIYAWSAADWARHARAAQVRIAISRNTLDADVLDVENGDETIEGAGAWVGAKRTRGEPSVIYIQESRVAALYAYFRAIPAPPPPVWMALWDGVAAIPPGIFAKQYANPTISHGHYDLSVVPDYWGGVDPPPPVPPGPTPPPPQPPPPGPPPPPPPQPPIDQTRSAWANLTVFITQDLPAAVLELLRLLGLYKQTP